MNDRTAQDILNDRRAAQPPQWGQPGYAPPAPQAPYYYRTSGMAIASLILGLLWLGGFGSLLAVIFGHCAEGEIRRSNGTVAGKGMAMAGLILGYLGIAFILLIIIAIASSAASTGY